MALTHLPNITLALGFRDIEGTEDTMRAHLGNPLDAAVPATAVPLYLVWATGDLLDAVQALTDSPATYYGITFRAAETAPPTFGAGESEMKGVFEFVNDQGRPSFRMAVPGINPAKLADNLRDILLTDTQVAAFVTLMTSGDFQPVDANGHALTAVPGGGAYKQHRRSLGGTGRFTG
jgi:hypothetical protein